MDTTLQTKCFPDFVRFVSFIPKTSLLFFAITASFLAHS